MLPFPALLTVLLRAQVETRLYQLISQVKQISNEQAYQRVSPLLCSPKVPPFLCGAARTPNRTWASKPLIDQS